MNVSTRPSMAVRPALTTSPVADLDFSKVDSADQAVLLPALGIASFATIMRAISTASATGVGMSSSLDATFGESTTAHIDYEMPDPHAPQLSGSGTIGGNNVSETWTVHPKTGVITISGQYGGSAEKITVQPHIDGLHVSGGVGNVGVRGKVGETGLGRLWWGSIGGQQVTQRMSTDLNDDGSPKGLHVEGSLGDAAINYDAKIEQTENGVKMSGSGIVAGNKVQIAQTVTYLPLR